MQKWENVLISGWKRCFVQTVHFAENRWKVVCLVQKWQNVLISAWKLCWKVLKSGAPSAKMTKRAVLGLKKAVFYKLVHFAENHLKVVHSVLKWQNVLNSSWKFLFCKNSCTLLKTLRSGVPSAKMRKRADIGLKTPVLYKLVHLTENSKKWCPQCKNEKTCWYRAENAAEKR